jgi:sigma-B regulation protein RsbU (phosphoserine phosphatase)
MKPADEVGGDYYDVLKEDGVIHIGIGDVTGHGLESGVLMLMTQTVIRTLIEHGETDPVAFVNTLNRTIYKNVHRMRTDKTLTFAQRLISSSFVMGSYPGRLWNNESYFIL